MKKIPKKKTVKKTAKKAEKLIFMSHFHCGNKLALTICSKRVPETDIYSIGMALVHDNDCGNKARGRQTAFDRCMSGLNEFNNNQKLLAGEFKLPTLPKRNWLMKFLHGELPAPELPQNLLTLVNDKGVHGKSGHWLVKDAPESWEKSRIKNLIEFLRKREIDDTDDTKYLNKLYHTIFFRLEEFLGQ